MSKPSIYTPIATGSTVPRDIRDRLSDIPNVKDFGAIGDGVTDDSLAFSAATTAANGKPVFVPQGSYVINNNISGKFFSYGKVNVTGTGKVIIYNLLNANLATTVTNGVIDTELYSTVTCVLNGNTTLSFINTPTEDFKTIYLIFEGSYNVTWPDNVIANDYRDSILSPNNKIIKITTLTKGNVWIVENVIEVLKDSISIEVDCSSNNNRINVSGTYYYVYKVPFTLYNTNISVTVNWGDGSPVEILTSADFSQSFSDAPYHVYAQGQTPIVTFTTYKENFSKLYYIANYSGTFTNIEINGSSTYSVNYAPAKGIKSIRNFIPFKGVCKNGSSSQSSDNSYYRMFESYQGSTILDTVFEGCTNITSFSETFANSKISSIPENLFEDCTNATDFSGCFKGCTSLTYIVENLFKDYTNATTFSSCFENCTSLTGVTGNIFENCTSATDFSSCFRGCTHLSMLSANMFKNCTSASNFSSCFKGCSITFEEDLFKYCTNATNFSNCFENQVSVSDIPQNLFKYCTNAHNFSSCFSGCTTLTEYDVPENLFKDCANITNLSGCFRNCTGIEALTLRFTALNISQVTQFVTAPGEYTIYVPEGSLSYMTFTDNIVLRDLGVTVIGY